MYGTEKELEDNIDTGSFNSRRSGVDRRMKSGKMPRYEDYHWEDMARNRAEWRHFVKSAQNRHVP